MFDKDKKTVTVNVEEYNASDSCEQLLYLPGRLAKILKTEDDVANINQLYKFLLYFGQDPNLNNAHCFRFFENVDQCNAVIEGTQMKEELLSILEHDFLRESDEDDDDDAAV